MKIYAGSHCSLLILMLAGVLLGDSTIASAQQNYLEQLGPPQAGAVVPVEFGNINLTNGNLHLEIPLGSFAQRGSLAYTASLVYDSRIWIAGQWSPTFLQSYRPYNVGDGHGNYAIGGWRMVVNVDDSASNWSATMISGSCNNELGTNSYNRLTNFMWAGPDGVAHTWTNLWTEQDFGTMTCPDAFGNSGATSGYADDGSGFYIVVTNYQDVVVYGPDGTQVYPAFKDSNGNYFSNDAAGNVIDTLGRVPVITTASGNNIFYDVLNSKGTRSRYTITTESISVSVPNYTGTLTVIQRIGLPSGTSYSFGYDSGLSGDNWGGITSMTLPLGGQISYGYMTFTDAWNIFGSTNRWVSSKTTSDGTWSYTPFVLGTGSQQVTVKKPNGDYAIYKSQGICQAGPFRNIERDFYRASGVLLRQELIDYGPDVCTQGTETRPIEVAAPPIRSTTVVFGSSGALKEKTEYDYTNSPSLGSPTKVSEWNFYTGTAPATPGRVRQVTYSLTNPTLAGAHIIGKPLSVTLSDGAGNQVAQTSFTYDNYTGNALVSTGACQTTTASQPAPAAPQHDYQNYCTSNTTRGNLTQVSKWLNTAGSSITTTTNTYDDTGNLVMTKDALSNPTTMEYSPPFGLAYITKITNAKSQVTAKNYDSSTGLLISDADPNNQATHYSYDSMGRLIQLDLPDGGRTNISFNNDAVPLTITTTQLATPDPLIVKYTVLDGLGRTQNECLTDPEGDDCVDTAYDSNGRIYSKSNPHRATVAPSDGITTFGYDGLDRPTTVTEPDGNVVSTSYDTQISPVPGETTTTTDETGRQRRSVTDAFGRLVEVVEPNPGALAAKATGSFTIIGSEQSGDSGSVTVSIGSSQYTYNYGAADTTGTIASSLGNLINANAGAVVTASGMTPTGDLPAANSGFEAPAVGTFQYNPAGIGWNFSGGSGLNSTGGFVGGVGIAANGSGLTLSNPPAPQGGQVAFIQGGPGNSFSQVISGFQANTSYAVTFYAAQRASNNQSFQDFDVLLDSTLLGTFKPVGNGYTIVSTAPFTTTDGAHTLTFAGRDTMGGDNTAFVDAVRVVAVPLLNAGFETPSLAPGTFQYQPAGGTWSFVGNSGITANNSGFTSLNPGAPEGGQVAFLQMGSGSVISQSLSGFQAGVAYSISFYAAQRSGNNQDFDVYLDSTLLATLNPAGSTYAAYSTQNFTTTAGPHTLKFVGRDTVGGDNTAFIDAVRLMSSGGSTIGLTAKIEGAAANSYTVTGTSTYNSAVVSQPSFTAASSGLSGGLDANALNNNPYITRYFYDLLDNLTCVEQHGNTTGSDCSPYVMPITSNGPPAADATSPWRIRRFAYDSLSRLRWSNDPESGLTTNIYDNNGNLISETDARGVIINYSPPGSPIDPLNRVTMVTYSDGTPSMTYGYDQGCCGVNPQNGVGRLTYASGGSTELVFAYDPMGRITYQADCPPSGIARGSCYSIGAAYDAAGQLIQLSYPDGRIVKNRYSAAGRMTGVTLASFGATAVNVPYYTVPQSTLPSSWGYWPAGAMNRGTFGNGVVETSGYGSRLQLNAISDAKGTSTLLNRSYGLYDSANHNNGNILSITDALNSTKNQTYSYDSLNRILTGTQADNTFNVTYTYDPWGNMKQSGTSNFNPIYDIHNRIQPAPAGCTSASTYCYDAAGNLLNDGFHAYSYDGEGRMKTVDSTATTYTYNPAGHRVRKDTSTGSAEYFYFGENMIAELNPATSAWTDYIYGYGKRIAKDTSTNATGAQYFHSDHIDSTRLVTDSAGNIFWQAVYNAFGQELAPQNTAITFQFAGMQYDPESALNHTDFRQYASIEGRWLTPDPYLRSMNPSNPQSLNRYVYVLNNPLNLSDPRGLDCFYDADAAKDANLPGLGVIRGDCLSDKDGGYFVDGHIDHVTIHLDTGDVGYSASGGTDFAGVFAGNPVEWGPDAMIDTMHYMKLAQDEASQQALLDPEINSTAKTIFTIVGKQTGPITKQIDCAAAFGYAFLPGIKPEDISELLTDNALEKGREALERQSDAKEELAKKLSRAKKKGTTQASRMARAESDMLKDGARVLKGAAFVFNAYNGTKNLINCESGKGPE